MAAIVEVNIKGIITLQNFLNDTLSLNENYRSNSPYLRTSSKRYPTNLQYELYLHVVTS